MPKDDHIIQIDDTISQIELSQCILHLMLECCGCVTQSKGHPSTFIKTKVANHECGILLGFQGHADLPKSTLEIHGGEVCSSSYAFQHFLYPGERVQIFLCPPIQTSKINAESKGIHLSFTPALLHYTRETS